MKVAVEKSLIPKPKIVCQRCGDEDVKTVMSSPFNHGYHRRHICKSCGLGFYSLSPYDMGPATTSPIPFHNEPITEAEEEERWNTWQRIKESFGKMEVPLWQRLGYLTGKKPEDMTNTETTLLAYYRALEKKAKDLEDASDT